MTFAVCSLSLAARVARNANGFCSLRLTRAVGTLTILWTYLESSGVGSKCASREPFRQDRRQGTAQDPERLSGARGRRAWPGPVRHESHGRLGTHLPHARV